MAEQAGVNGFDFSKAMVVVTGAASGIGLGIAQAFHAAGGRVALGERRINVNCIAPGYINTKPDTEPVDTDFKNAMLRNIPWRRFGTPAEVAQAALYLASFAADYVTGEVLAVNGGAFAGRAYLPFNKPIAR